MNGIIHTCSHINEDNCETQVTEEEIFRNVFHYLDVSWTSNGDGKYFFVVSFSND